MRLNYVIILITIISTISIVFSQNSNKQVPVPEISSEWWQIAGNPDLGKYTTKEQQPVDFGIWQAEDGTWQLWSCIRKSNFPGSHRTTRFLYGWEGEKLTSTNWKPQGIKWQAESDLGETPGGIQAPHVIKEDMYYYLFYGDWKRICLAKSLDGKHFKRVLGSNGQPDLFTEHSSAGLKHNTARDPMVLKFGNTFYCYYTSHLEEPVDDGWAFCRTSLNLKDWSESVVISHTDPTEPERKRFSDECPHVVHLPEYKLFYLFVTQEYGENSQTTVYASPNPMYFGIDDKSRIVCTLPIAAPEIIIHEGHYYIASLMSNLKGVGIARLQWNQKNK